MKCFLASAFLAVAAAAAAAGESPLRTVVGEKEADGSGLLGITAYYKQQVVKSWSCTLGSVTATCHGCTGACGLHYLKIEKKDVEKRVRDEFEKEASSLGLKGLAKAGIDIVVRGVGKSSDSADLGADGKSDSSSGKEGKDQSDSSMSADIELGTKSHAPKCWIWKIRGNATLSITLMIERKITRTNVLINVAEHVEDELASCPVVAVSVENTIDETNCCCASRMGSNEESKAASPGGSPGTGPKPPAKSPAVTGRPSDARYRAADFLGTLDDRFVASLPPGDQERALAGIRTSAASGGVDLSSLGDWKTDFLAGAYRSPSNAPSAMYLGRSGDCERFVVPERLESGRKPDVVLGGKPVPADEVAVVPASGGGEFTLVSVRHEPRPRGATIAVNAPSGNTYRGEKPPDPLVVATSTTVRRGPSATVITVTPSVETRAPDGQTTASPPSSDPAAGRPAYTAKDDSGFWSTLFQGLSLAGSVLVPLGTTFLVQPKDGGSSAVRSGDGGSMTVEVPNQAYDAALAQAQKTDPSFGNQGVANSLQAGLSSAAAGTGNGITVTSAFVPGGSTTSVKPGDTVVFSVTADAAVGPIFKTGAVQVALADGGRTVGYMPVQEAFLDPQSRQGAVSASLPPGLSSASGSFTATVTCGPASSNPVVLRLDPGAVEVIAIQKTVVSGTVVQVKLVNRSGGPVKGNLSLSGPGAFIGSSNPMHFDAWSSASALVQTTNPGAVSLAFTPDEGSGTAGMEKMFK